MDAFQWNHCFITGLTEVDEQHHRIVDAINRFGVLVMQQEGASLEEMEAVFVELADYARYHFAEEETLMTTTQVDARHVDQHRQSHASFIAEVTQLHDNLSANNRDAAKPLLQFLTHWLAFHILGSDQFMARQIAAIRSGNRPEDAYREQTLTKDPAIDTLLSALNGLFRQVSERNRELVHLNKTLEARVAERTLDLRRLVEQLGRNNAELKVLNDKLAQSQGQLLQSEKMAAVGQLAAGVAHEINNPIGFVNSNLGTLKDYVKRLLFLVDSYERNSVDSSAAQSAELQSARKQADLQFLRDDMVALLAESRDGLERVKKIVQDLRDFSRVDSIDWNEADLIAGLESTLNVASNELKYKAEVIKKYGEMPPVRCHLGQINQVFMNLVVNAAQAIEEHGTITLASGTDGPWAWVSIEDTGKGMTPEVLKRIFEPFFTTKPVGKGTGLGLSLAYDIVKKHGGHIDVSSEPGRGSFFKVWLPVAGPENPKC